MFLNLESNGRCPTNKYFQIIGRIHDIESYFPDLDHRSSLNCQIFFCHWGHLAIIFVWVSTNVFHIGWIGNYELCLKNAIPRIPIADGISEPHFGLLVSRDYPVLSTAGDYTIVLSSGGIYNWLLTLGFKTVFEVYNFLIISILLAGISIPLALLHLIFREELLHWLLLRSCHKPYFGCPLRVALHINHQDLIGVSVDGIFIPPFKLLFKAYFDCFLVGLNFHTGILSGFLSGGWSAHLVHVAVVIEKAIPMWVASGRGKIPASLDVSCSMTRPLCKCLSAFYSANWVLYCRDIHNDNHIFRSSVGRSEAILTLVGALKSNTISLYLTDIVHHQLGVGILFVWATHVYNSLYKGFAHTGRDVFKVNANSGPMIGPLQDSVHLQQLILDYSKNSTT